MKKPIELHFRALGDGPTLILLHGLLGSLDNWLPLGRRFAAQFKVFAVDQRNHGLSPHSAEFGYDIMARDLHEFMRSQGLTSAHVLGHSMGGKTAMQFALLYPDHVDKLVVADMSPRAYPPVHGETLAALQALDLKSFPRRDQIDSALTVSVPDVELRQFLLKNVKREATGAFGWKVNLPVVCENYQHLIAALEAEQTFSKPALFVRGDQSDYITDADFDLIRRLFPRADFKTIAEAGHWVHADAAGEFFEEVMRFLTAASLNLDALGVRKMASGHLRLLLSEHVSWEDFPSFATEFLRLFDGKVLDRCANAALQGVPLSCGRAFRFDSDFAIATSDLE